MKKWPTITNSPLRMLKFPVGAIPVVVENTWIKNNTGVALEKGTVPPPFPGKFPVKKWPMITMSRFPGSVRRAVRNLINSLKIYFLKITKILVNSPLPPPLLIGASVIPPYPSLENHLWLCCCEIFLYLLQNILIVVFILLFVSYLRKNIGYTKNSYM